MSKWRKVLDSARNNPAGLRFAELQGLLGAAGFILARVSGSHHVYKRAGVAEIVDIQPRDGMAKTYQVRQVMELLDRYEIDVG